MSDDETESWHWADADGVVSIVDEWELLSSLSTGSLPHYILVWRPGWKQWVPACQVGELANTLPKDKIETAVEPGSDPLLTDPPPPPVDRYQAYQTREAAAKLMGKVGKAAPRAPVAPPTGRGGGSMPPPPPPPPPPQPALRPAQPTLVDGAPAGSTATLRPPGAVPPPPRGVPTPPPSHTVEPVAAAAALSAMMAPVIQVKPPDEPVPASVEVPTNPRGAEGLGAAPASAPLPSWSDDLDAEVRAGAGPARMHQTGYAPVAQPYVQPVAKKSTGLIIAVLALGALVVLVVVAGVALKLRAGKDGATPATSAGSEGRAADKTRIVPCKLEKAAARLAPMIHPSIAPATAVVGGGAKFAVGFAASEREAEGITVDASSLAVDRPFRQKTERDVASVVPLTAHGDLSFTVDEEDRAFRSARTLDVKAKLSIGWSDQGLARRVGSGEPATVWPGPSDKVTDPRTAPLPGGGFAVTVRRGGQSGSVLVGLFDDSGDKKSELTEVSSKPQVGSPAITASDRGVLVAFAGRPTDDSYWTLQVGAAPPGSTPRVAQGFATPPGGLGADAISPAVEGLSNGRWLLQWTEGAAGKRQVRVQTLGFDLVPVGDPINLSPEEANAGQGVVMVRGEKALSLFLVKKGKTHELWGATLSCP